jgi:EmrB/QacA subfamily drug resistance transporter
MSHIHSPGLAAGPGQARGALAEHRPWSLLVLTSVAQFMVVLDITVVNIALPSIGRALRFAPADLQWVVSAYVLVTGGLTLLGGRAADLIGRRRMFLTGLGLFTAASLASGLAPDAGALIATRAAQGLGAALLTPAALAIITSAYTGVQRAAALSVWGALAAGGSAAGLLAGGAITTWLGWRWVFLINVPIGVAAAVGGLHLVPRTAGSASAGRGAGASAGWGAQGGRRLDLAGAVLPVAGIGTAVYAITGAAQHGWGSVRTVLLLALAAVLLAAFALAERRATEPLVPPRALRSRTLVTGALVMLTGTGILVGVLFLSSLYLQSVLRASPIRAGLEFLPLVATTGAGAHLASRLLPRTGPRVLAATGLATMAAGGLLLWQVSGYVGGLLPGFVLIGAGAGVTFPAASVTAMHAVPPGETGLASGLVTTGHEVGASLGVAVFSAIGAATAGFSVTGTATGDAGAYQHVFGIAAVIAAVLAILAALAVPAARPASGTSVAGALH